MMKPAQVIAPLACVLFLALLPASTVHAQACGRSFVDITVVDSDGKSVSDAVIELVAEVHRVYPVREGAVTLSRGNNPVVKLSPQDAEEVIKRGKPLDKGKDVCGNPLKQVANLTKVTRAPAYVEGREFSVKNFGFCTLEGYRVGSLLKVSAPGYVTDYYAGAHLGGCGRSYKIVLTKVRAALDNERAEP